MVKNCWRKGYGIVLGIKRWFNELFDGNLVEYSMWGFRILNEKGNDGIEWCLKVVSTVSVNNKEKKKSEKKAGEKNT